MLTVSNGSYNHPSNAHTLDWKGNAWFAKDVYIGGTSQNDESAKKLSAVIDTVSILSSGSNNNYLVSDGEGGINWVEEEPITLEEIKMLFELEIGTFTLDVHGGGSYEFEIGMTWAEFISSKYNVAGFTLDDEDGVKLEFGLTRNAQSVKVTELIEDGAVYNVGGGIN